MKIKKKFTTGTAQTFISRKRALKKLQLTLKDFRRLCILKGIYPREPKHIKKTNKGGSTQNKIYYHLKDIIFLSQESLIGKFREYKTFLRKVNHARAKRNDIKVQTLFKSKPIFNYDHIVKERFPTFTSALRDLDDALCLCFAFASLTQSPLANQKVIKRCKRLVTEFMHFVIEAKALTKVFISIKGIYYQAEIMGERVTWISGHERSVGRANELDFTAMANFVDFYTCMLAFVNFRLFKSIGLFYPPQLQQQQQMMAENEYDFKQLDTDDRVYSLAFPLRRTEKTEEPDVEMDTFAEDNTDGADFLEKLRQAEALKKLFSKFKFFLNREVPKESLAFVIRSCGGFVCWDGCAPNSITESSELITHQVVDRNLEKMDMSRVYVQPQWVFDCFNARRLLPTLKYAPSAVLPPHLSPFVDENTIHSVRTELEEELKDSNKTDTGSVQKTQKQPKKVETVDNKGVMRVQKSRVFKESQQKKTNEEGHNLKLREMMIPKRHKRVYEKIKRGAKSKEKAVNNLNRKRAKLDTSAGA